MKIDYIHSYVPTATLYILEHKNITLFNREC